MKHLAIFGGTFNPFHNGHFQILNAVSQSGLVDKILLIPSKIPPHKEVGFLADEKHRLNMCRLAAEEFENASVTDIELLRSGKSYTIDTLHELIKRYPDYKPALIIGGDMMASFSEWKDYKQILKIADLIVFSRKGIDLAGFEKSISDLTKIGANIFVFDDDIDHISSTQIRNNIGNLGFLGKYIPKNILDYIISNGVYDE